MERILNTLEPAQCRRCCAYCDKLIDPAECIDMGCVYLYSYHSESNGRQYMGCLRKIFRAEIDMELFRTACRSRLGYGGIRAVRQPLSHCPFTVERAYLGDGEAFHCVNQRFLDCHEDGPFAYRVFDLRDVVSSS